MATATGVAGWSASRCLQARAGRIALLVPVSPALLADVAGHGPALLGAEDPVDVRDRLVDRLGDLLPGLVPAAVERRQPGRVELVALEERQPLLERGGMVAP